jgi:hypothetical protein
VLPEIFDYGSEAILPNSATSKTMPFSTERISPSSVQESITKPERILILTQTAKHTIQTKFFKEKSKKRE